MKSKQIYHLPYEITADGIIKSYEWDIEYTNRWGTTTKYRKKSYVLKYDWKVTNGHKLARVTLYDPDTKTNKDYYVAKLLYAVFFDKQYNEVRNIHYKNKDTTDIRLDNIYQTNQSSGNY